MLIGKHDSRQGVIWVRIPGRAFFVREVSMWELVRMAPIKINPHSSLQVALYRCGPHGRVVFHSFSPGDHRTYSVGQYLGKHKEKRSTKEAAIVELSTLYSLSHARRLFNDAKAGKRPAPEFSLS